MFSNESHKIDTDDIVAHTAREGVLFRVVPRHHNRSRALGGLHVSELGSGDPLGKYVSRAQLSKF